MLIQTNAVQPPPEKLIMIQISQQKQYEGQEIIWNNNKPIFISEGMCLKKLILKWQLKLFLFKMLTLPIICMIIYDSIFFWRLLSQENIILKHSYLSFFIFFFLDYV